mmetsp:Transcript_315/g.578  ORF Transcript_315/g.578 Transcript_315/m.578 type:complete len:106 (+) Transcript_315:662-979(+)
MEWQLDHLSEQRQQMSLKPAQTDSAGLDCAQQRKQCWLQVEDILILMEGSSEMNDERATDAEQKMIVLDVGEFRQCYRKYSMQDASRDCLEIEMSYVGFGSLLEE